MWLCTVRQHSVFLACSHYESLVAGKRRRAVIDMEVIGSDAFVSLQNAIAAYPDRSELKQRPRKGLPRIYVEAFLFCARTRQGCVPTRSYS